MHVIQAHLHSIIYSKHLSTQLVTFVTSTPATT